MELGVALGSRRRRMRAVHSLWEDAVATMDVDAGPMVYDDAL